MEHILNIAIAQSSGELFGRQRRLDWLSNQLDKLDGKNIDLILLPELSSTGYNVGEKLIEWAEPHDGKCAQAISKLARQHDIAIHYGFPELKDGKIFNSAQCFNPKGQSLNIHRKLILPPGFEGDHFTPGKGCKIFEYNGFKIATLICYDAEFPETFRHVASLGAQLVLVPTALGEQWEIVARNLIPTRAFENGIYVAYANHAGVEDDITYLGESCIIAPNGRTITSAGSKEEIIFEKLETSSVHAAQKRLPYLSDLNRIQLSKPFS